MAREHMKEDGCKNFVTSCTYKDCKSCPDNVIECVPDCPRCIEQSTARAIKEALEKEFENWKPDKWEDRDGYFTWQQLKEATEAVFKEYGV